MHKTNEDGSLFTTWLIVNKGAPAIIKKAIEEVQDIFRSAKSIGGQAGGITDGKADSCVLWASKEHGFLDSLW
jgi:hypothetical protein